MAKQYHIACDEAQIGKWCILPGDPARTELIASYFDEAHYVGANREYTVWTGTLEGERVSTVSTGIGGPSAAIAMEELVALGAHTFIRVGTCGGIALPVTAGDAVIATAAVRAEGTSREYAPLAFPAVADFEVTQCLVRAAQELNRPYKTGVVQSKDSFYGQHAPHTMPVEKELEQRWEAWKRLGVLASEMEAAALFTVAAARGVRCGACFHCMWNQERKSIGLTETDSHDTASAVQVAVEALRLLIRERK